MFDFLFEPHSITTIQLLGNGFVASVIGISLYKLYNKHSRKR